jgi:hypothetical protein
MLLIQSLVQDYGITTAAGNDNIFSNTINGLISSSGTGATIVNGIAITSSTTKNVYGNTFTIYKLIISLQEVLVV